MQLKTRLITAIVFAFCMLTSVPSESQRPIDPVFFKPFVDGRNWILAENLEYEIGVSNVSVTVPPGFVTDFASIPPALHSLIQKEGRYLLPAVVHDYLYWKQTCTRKQSDQIFLIAMVEHGVSDFHRTAIINVVQAAGGFAWDDNAEERAAKKIRIVPKDRLKIPANTIWPEYRKLLTQDGEVDGPDTTISADFCARGDMSVERALREP